MGKILKKLKVPFAGLLAFATLGVQARSLLKIGRLTDSPEKSKELSDLNSSVVKGSADIVERSRQKYYDEIIRNGVFTVTSTGELNLVGTIRDFEELKVEALKSRLESLYAKSTVPTSEF